MRSLYTARRNCEGVISMNEIFHRVSIRKYEDRPVEKEKILFECQGSSMGLSRLEKIDMVVSIDPVKYYTTPYKDKYSVGKALGIVNWAMRGKNKKMLLLTPGRIGTSSPELGVPTAFADISAFEVICEVEEKTVGYNPELSYGSHFFQDLVEAEILYTAVFSDAKTKAYHPEKLHAFPDITGEFLKEGEENPAEHVVKVYDSEGRGCYLYHDLSKERLLLRL